MKCLGKFSYTQNIMIAIVFISFMVKIYYIYGVGLLHLWLKIYCIYDKKFITFMVSHLLHQWLNV